MMIFVENIAVNAIPVLKIDKREFTEQPLPGVIFLHGHTSAKEHNLHYAYLLAEKGFRVFLPDAYMHGERAETFTSQEIYQSFWKIVLKSIAELELLKKQMIERYHVYPDRISLGGTSMGAITTLGALTQYEWIRNAFSMMGDPAYVELAKQQLKQIQHLGFESNWTEEEIQEELTHLSAFDLSLHPEKLQDRSLFFWHGEKDPIVPMNSAYQFYEKMKENVGENQLSFVSDKRAGHAVSRSGLLDSVNWVEKSNNMI